MITADAIRYARVLVRMSPRELADKAGVSVATLWHAEQPVGSSRVSVATLEAIQRALEAAGVEFTNGDQPGVRLRKQG